MTIHNNYSLKQLNTFGIDVNAKQYAELFDELELIEFLKSQSLNNEPLLILGGGSNILFTKDFEGTVVKYSAKGIKIIEETDTTVTIKTEAGEVWDKLVSFSVENNYYGIENLTLIPGTVGAAPIQNIGAYGVEIKDVFEYLEGYFLNTSKKKVFKNSECMFDYRNSLFKKELKDKFLITSVTLKLSKEKRFNLSYRALNDHFGNVNHEQLTIKQINEAVKQIRTSKLPDFNKLGNAGSFFKNPEIKEDHFERLHKKFPDIVFHKIARKYYKIPAGWLIEKCGFKGKRIGEVGTYDKQALVIINYGNANGEEVKSFAEKIREKVFTTFQIKLETEVNII